MTKNMVLSFGVYSNLLRKKFSVREQKLNPKDFFDDYYENKEDI